MKISDDDSIPTAGSHRDVALHFGQSSRRIERVKQDIDAAHALDDPAALMAFLRNPLRAPESRILAGAKLLALWEGASDRRETRPEIDLDLISGLVGALRSRKWRSRTLYGSLLAGIGGDVERDPLDERVDE